MVGTDPDDLSAEPLVGADVNRDLIADARLMREAGDLERGGTDGGDPADPAGIAEARELGLERGEVGEHANPRSCEGGYAFSTIEG